MQITRDSFYRGLLVSKWDKAPEYRKVFLSFESALKNKGAKSFEYYRNDEADARFHLAMQCDLNGHQVKLGKYTKADNSDNKQEYALFVDRSLISDLQTPEEVTTAVQQISSHLIRSNNMEDEELVEYLQTHGLSQDQDNDEFCPLQLAIGAIVETEHTDDFDAAVEIAKDHLEEDSGYYGEPKFKDEAIERIGSLEPEEYEESEVLEANKSWKSRFLKACRKAMLSSNRHYFRVGPLCICSSYDEEIGGTTGNDLVTDASALQFNVNGKSIWVSGESGDLEILTPDERIYVEPEDRSLPVEYILKEYTGSDTGDIVPVVSSFTEEECTDCDEEFDEDEILASFIVPVRVPITSMSMKDAEGYFKSGMLTKKELLAFLTSEEGWSDSEAKQIADFWERCHSSYALVKVGYSRKGFVPEANLFSSAVADILSSVDNGNPKQAILSYVSEAWDMEPVTSDRKSNRGLMFTAKDYYRKVGVIPTYRDFVGYLRYTGEFEDYKQAFTAWKKLCKELDPIDGDDE